MRKVTLLILAGVLLAGCSRNPFHPEMKGIGFWEPPQKIAEAINKHSFDDIGGCFSRFIVLSGNSDWSDFQMSRKLSMGVPQNMALRVTHKHKTLVRDEDIAEVEWGNTDKSHAHGAFKFDAFYGSGRVVFKAMQKSGEWVIHYMAIPRKDSAGEGSPHVVFDLSEAEVEELMK